MAARTGSTIPNYIAPAARAVAAGECRFGIVFGGSGTGEQIAANKIRGIRCCRPRNRSRHALAREHNDANMMAMGARIVGAELAIACVEAFLGAEFQGGRHEARVAKIAGPRARLTRATHPGDSLPGLTGAVRLVSRGLTGRATSAWPGSD